MTTPELQKSAASRRFAQAGYVLSALAVFGCGWLGMQTNDWRLMIVYALMAVGAAALAAAFSRRR